MAYRLIKAAQARCDPLWQLWIAVVEQPGQAKPEQGHKNRHSAKSQLGCRAGLRFGSFRLPLRKRHFAPGPVFGIKGSSSRVKYRSQKFLKTIAAAQRPRNPDPPSGDGK